MSKETQKWLNDMVLVGYAAPQHNRGDAWHRTYGQSPNSFPDAVPMERVHELISSWEPVKVTPQYETDTGEFKPLKTYAGDIPVAVTHSGNGALLGIFSDKYPDHGYKERLIDRVEGLLGDNLNVGSAGLLDGYRKAWVQVETPDTIQHPSGERYRPFVTAMSSLDGTVSSTYKLGVSRVVCDNTFDVALKEHTKTHKVKNSRNSLFKIQNAREALDIVFKVSEAYSVHINELLDTPVTEDNWIKFKNIYVPVPEEKGRGQTIATKKRDAIEDLYFTDERVAPWSGTAWGVLQAVNTYERHLSTVRKIGREERNQINWMKGLSGDADEQVESLLEFVLSA